MELVLKEQGEDIICVEIGGDFTFSESSKFREMLKRLEVKKASRIVVDLSKTDFIDSSALGMMLLLKEKADAMNAEVEISGAQGQVLQVLELSRFQDLFILGGDASSTA